MERIKRHGYWYVLDKSHPAGNKQGYVAEHRIIMEREIGRYLTGMEIIHHKNGLKDDNRIENLQLFEDKKIHNRVHKGWFTVNGFWYKRCGKCGTLLEVSKNNFDFSKGISSSWCKECRKIWARENYKKNSKHILERNKKYINNLSKEKKDNKKEQYKRWKEKNIDKVNKYKKEWYLKKKQSLNKD